MKKQSLTLTIGISVYNEEKNISSLINSLIKQSQATFRLKKIVVASDGSTDNTVSFLKQINNPLLTVFNNKKRKGKLFRMNQIISQTKSDILVILDGDILIQDKNFLNKLINPIIKDKADLTSASIRELTPINFMQKILASSTEFKNFIYQNYKNGNHIYTCHGRARAFSRQLFRSLFIPFRFYNIAGDDAFSYLYCKSHHFKYQYAKSAVLLYKLPMNFSDHQKQSHRFFVSQKELSKKFDKKFVQHEYYLPISLVLKSTLRSIFKNPLIFIYFIIVFLLKIRSLFNNKSTPIWSIAKSSKI